MAGLVAVNLFNPISHRTRMPILLRRIGGAYPIKALVNTSAYGIREAGSLFVVEQHIMKVDVKNRCDFLHPLLYF